MRKEVYQYNTIGIIFGEVHLNSSDYNSYCIVVTIFHYFLRLVHIIKDKRIILTIDEGFIRI